MITFEEMLKIVMENTKEAIPLKNELLKKYDIEQHYVGDIYGNGVEMGITIYRNKKGN